MSSFHTGASQIIKIHSSVHSFNIMQGVVVAASTVVIDNLTNFATAVVTGLSVVLAAYFANRQINQRRVRKQVEGTWDGTSELGKKEAHELIDFYRKEVETLEAEAEERKKDVKDLLALLGKSADDYK